MFRPPVLATRLARASLAQQSSTIRRQLSISRPRYFHPTAARAVIPQWPNDPIPQPPVGPADELDDFKNSGKNRSKDQEEKRSFWEEWSHSASFQAALTTVVGLGMVFGAGTGYLQWYKAHVLHRVERAFDGGYDPALELASVHSPQPNHINRREQPLVDAIFRGEEAGGYYLIVGSKGTGKGTLLLDAMRAVHAEGASICEAHPDLEVFRLRLGKSLDFDFFEDWQGSLFSRAEPRTGGPSLDIERAMTKLEKVALRYTRKNRRPLVMGFTNIHLFPNTEEGQAVLYQLQQRAEAWAQAGIMTMVFTTDDFWCLDKMKKNGSRMRILSVYDLSAKESISALRLLRRHNLWLREQDKKPEDITIESDRVLRRVYELIGGRTSFLTRVARAGDMLREAEALVEMEKGWMLSKIGLIPEMDDDVMDEQKWASCSWLLLRHLAQEGPKLIPPMDSDGNQDEDDDDPEVIHVTPSPIDILEKEKKAPIKQEEPVDEEPMSQEELEAELVMPKVSYDDARRLMTRADFFEGLDHANIISIDVKHEVRPDSVVILRAAQQVVSDPDFDDMLDTTRDRVDEIEGLHRQAELTVKEPFRATLNRGLNGRLVVDVVGLGASFVPEEEDDDDDDKTGEEQTPTGPGEHGRAQGRLV